MKSAAMMDGTNRTARMTCSMSILRGVGEILYGVSLLREVLQIIGFVGLWVLGPGSSPGRRIFSGNPQIEGPKSGSGGVQTHNKFRVSWTNQTLAFLCLKWAGYASLLSKMSKHSSPDTL